MGDAVFAAFPQENAAAVVRALSELQQILDRDSLNPVLKGCAVHVRVHAGTAACGDVGPRGEKRFDILGNSVNELFMMREKGFALSQAARDLLAADR
jgi:class 3 adenylate cyclase